MGAAEGGPARSRSDGGSCCRDRADHGRHAIVRIVLHRTHVHERCHGPGEGRARYPERRIWAVWQPHTYSRTEALFDEFTQAFKDANQVIVTEVYAAREQSDGFSAQQLVKKMQHSFVHFSPDLEEAAGYLLNHLQSGDVVLVLSAGDADQISTRVLAALKD